jgi:hypothetical protein
MLNAKQGHWLHRQEQRVIVLKRDMSVSRWKILKGVRQCAMHVQFSMNGIAYNTTLLAKRSDPLRSLFPIEQSVAKTEIMLC